MRCRLGGPERSPVESIGLRRALGRALAPLTVEGLDEIDVFLTLGGSITSGEGDGGVHNLRYSATRRRITANVVVPASEIAASSAAPAAAAHFAVLARRIAERCAPDRADDLAAAFDAGVRAAT